MIVGIDLGTTNSSVSVYMDGAVRLIPNAFGDVLTPSIVSFDKDGTYYVGAVAKERLVTNPESTYKEFKRDMGTDKQYEAFGKKHTPEELSALVLKQLKEDAERFTNEEIKDAVISVPAYFSDKQRAATRNAGIIAGLNVICLINEPSAAALTYHVANIEEDEKYLVFDFGGGTLDVTLVDAFDNIIEIQSISGDNYLGGADFNRVIALDICLKNDLKWANLSSAERAILLNHGEDIKKILTDNAECQRTIILNGKEYPYSLNRQGLLDISSEIFNKITIVLKRIMNDAGLQVNDLDGIIMIGGSSKMPIVQLFIQTLFQGRAKYEKNGDTIVCEGAGIVAGIKERKDEVRDIVLTDICPFSLGTAVSDGSFSVIIPQNQVLPCSMVEFYTNAYDFIDQIKFKVYQGENIVAEKNQLLSEIIVPIEKRPRGQVVLRVRYSYDINGIFDVEISGDGVLVNQYTQLGNSSGLSEDEIAKKRGNLQAMKKNMANDNYSQLLIEKACRLAEECNIKQREQIELALRQYIQTIHGTESYDPREARTKLEEVIHQVEDSMFSFSDFDADLWRTYIDKEVEKKDTEEQ